LILDWAGGLFYKFRKDKRSMGIGIRYFQGLTDILPSTDGKQVNSALQLNVTIRSARAKSMRTKAPPSNQGSILPIDQYEIPVIRRHNIVLQLLCP
jgi:hypothetical protein